MQNDNLYGRLSAHFSADCATIAIETTAGAYRYADIDHATACLANLLRSADRRCAGRDSAHGGHYRA